MLFFLMTPVGYVWLNSLNFCSFWLVSFKFELFIVSFHSIFHSISFFLFLFYVCVFLFVSYLFGVSVHPVRSGLRGGDYESQ